MTKLVNILKKPLAAAGLLSVALASGVASADFNPKFYVGAGVDYNYYGKKDFALGGSSNFSQKVNGMGVVVPVLGVKFNEHFGIEAGYSFNKKYKGSFTGDVQLNGANIFANNITASYNAKIRNAYLDLVGFMPVADQVELIGGVGIGKLTVKSGDMQFSNVPAGATARATLKIKNKMGFRAKVGAIYNVTNNIGLRLLASYQSINNKINSEFDLNNGAGVRTQGTTSNGKFMKSMTSIGLSATYTF